MCGENRGLFLMSWLSRGSSPRVRGKHFAKRRHAVAGGLIPACAGKTTAPTDCSRSAAAHPRVCGENTVFHVKIVTHPGSSPRVRGKLASGMSAKWNIGLIPACAGKTPWPGFHPFVDGAHPRVCGENLDRDRLNARRLGSSPRVRGKRRLIIGGLITSRLIPACAGKTG